MVALLMAMLVRVRLGAVNCLVDSVLMEMNGLDVVLVIVCMVQLVVSVVIGVVLGVVMVIVVGRLFIRVVLKIVMRIVVDWLIMGVMIDNL